MTLPSDRFVSTLTMPVRYSDCDVMGIVHHSRYVVYLEDARLHFSKTVGVDFVKVMQDGIALAVVALEIQYKRSLAFEDVFQVNCWLEEVKSRTLKFGYEIHRANEQSVDMILTATVSLISVSRSGVPTRIPEKFFKPLSDTLRSDKS